MSGTRWADDMPAAYDRWLVPTVFRPFALDLVRRVTKHAPTDVLELAAGTGVLTVELCDALPDATITATDLNVAMVDLGRARAPDARWRQANATELPFDDATFDVVVCQFGVMFFYDRPRAFADVRRVLRAGGTFVGNAWGRIDAHDFEATVVAALGRVFPDDPPRFLETLPHACADPSGLVEALHASGLRCDGVDTIVLEGEAVSVEGLVTGYCTGTPLRAQLEDRGDLASITKAMVDEVVSAVGDGPWSGRMEVHVFEAAHG